MKKNREMRSFVCEMRAEENEAYGNILIGRPIVYGSETDMGWYAEEIEKGALNGADLKDVRFLVNHNTDMIPLARSRNNNVNSTMQLTVDDDGLKVRVNLDTENNSEARALYSAVSRGDVSGMSFMFTVSGDRWENIETDYPKRYITKFDKIFECSAVTFPAYPDTSIQSASAENDTLENVRISLENARAEARANEDIKELEKLKLEIMALA